MINMNDITASATVEYMRVRIEALENEVKKKDTELEKKDLHIELLIEKIKKAEIDRDINIELNGKRKP